MKPLRLEFQGIKSYSEKAVVDFSLLTKSGLFGIFGDTGSGKSTILDAMVFALYGEFYESGVLGAELINARSDKMCVDFSFSVKESGGTAVYRAHRELKSKGTNKSQPPQKALLYREEGGVQFSVAETVSTVNEKIVSVIGLTKEQFVKCIVLPQGQFSAFLSLTRAPRIKIISALFDLDKYGVKLKRKLGDLAGEITLSLTAYNAKLEQYADATKERVDEYKSKLSVSEKAIKEQDEVLTKIKEDFSIFERNYVTHNKYLKCVSQLEAMKKFAPLIEKKRGYLSDYERALDALKISEKLENKGKVSLNLKSEVNAYKERLDKLKKEKEVFVASSVEEEKLVTAQSALKSLDDNLSLLSSDRLSVLSASEKRKELRRNFLEITERLENVSRDIESIKSNISAVEKEIETFSFKEKISAAIDSLTARAKKEFIENETDFLNGLALSCNDPETVRSLLKRADELKSDVTIEEGGQIVALDEVKALLTENERLTTLKTELNDKLSRLELSLKKIEAYRQKIVDDGKNLSATIESFDKKLEQAIKAFSNVCSYNVGGDYETCRRTVKELKIKADLEIDTYRKKAEYFDKNLPLAEKDLEFTELKLESSLNEQAALKKELEEKLGDMTYNRAKEVAEAVSDYELMREEVEGYGNRLFSLKKETEEMAAALEGGDYSTENYEKRKAETTVAEENYKNSYKEYIKLRNYTEILSQNFENRCIIEKDCKKIRDEKKVCDALSELVKSDRLAEYVADEYLSEICVDAEDTLSELSSGRYGLRYDGDFYVIDYLNGGAERKTTTVSGGELFLVSLSLALALSKSIILKSNKPIEFFFLDEGFGSLDGALVETVTDSLEKLRNDNFTIGLISHVEALKERIPAKINVSGPTPVKGSTLTVTV